MRGRKACTSSPMGGFEGLVVILGPQAAYLAPLSAHYWPKKPPVVMTTVCLADQSSRASCLDSKSGVVDQVSAAADGLFLPTTSPSHQQPPTAAVDSEVVSSHSFTLRSLSSSTVKSRNQNRGFPTHQDSFPTSPRPSILLPFPTFPYPR